MTGRTLFTAAAAREGKPASVAWRAASLDIEGCERVEFVTKGTPDCPQWYPAWPADIREAVEGAIRRWLKERAVIVRAITSAVVGPPGSAATTRACVVIVHFEQIKNGPVAATVAPEDAPDPAAPTAHADPGTAGAAKSLSSGDPSRTALVDGSQGDPHA